MRVIQGFIKGDLLMRSSVEGCLSGQRFYSGKILLRMFSEQAPQYQSHGLIKCVTGIHFSATNTPYVTMFLSKHNLAL